MKTTPLYNSIGNQYAANRIPDPRIAKRIWAALGDARTVCNIGAGTGSYEPTDRSVTAVEPSELMISQRRYQANVVQASAESLPFEDQQFDAAMTVLSIHHWNDATAGLHEMKRISNRQVILTFDPSMNASFWLIRDYLPEAIDFDNSRAPSIESIVAQLGGATVEPVPIPWDCTDGFQAAYWRRPEYYLNPDVRLSISTFAQLPSEVVEPALERLRLDLESGIWHQRYRDSLSLDEADFGYRLIIRDASETQPTFATDPSQCRT